MNLSESDTDVIDSRQLGLFDKPGTSAVKNNKKVKYDHGKIIDISQAEKETTISTQ